MFFNWYRGLSLKFKIISLLSGTLFFCLTVGFALVVYFNIALWQREALDTARERTRILADFGSELLSQGDDHSATTLLRKFSRSSDVKAALILDQGGEPFASFQAPDFSKGEMQKLESAHPGRYDELILSSRKIRRDGQIIGQVLLVTDTLLSDQKILEFLFLLFGLFLFICLLAVFVSYKLQPYIAEPILALARVARGVSSGSDYERDALSYKSDDEIGDLYRSFDGMMCRIKSEQKDRDKAESALRESESRYRAIVEDQTDFICRFDSEGKILFANTAYCEHFGYRLEDMIGRVIYDFVHPLDRAQLRASIEGLRAGKEVEHNEHRVIASGGQERAHHWINRLLFDREGNPGTYQGVGRDITDLKNAENERTELMQKVHNSQRLETIGTLAGGIAHDFNNILTPITGYLYLAEQEIPEGNPAKGYIKTIVGASDRARELVDQILSFSRNSSVFKREPVNLEELVDETLKLLRATVPRTIEFELRRNLDGAKVFADKAKMHQILMNLCTNAYQAIEGERGVISITLTCIDRKQAAKLGFLHAGQGKHIFVEVADTGRGMEPETLERIFEPFYTTKTVGQGTGLGLSVVHGLVRSHKGQIAVQSRLGQGSAFKLIFPEYRGSQHQDLNTRVEVTRGSERVLFVDDEEPICKLGRDMLEHMGYSVDVSSNPRQALGALEANPDRYDLVITDLTMPGLTGVELARKIKSIKSGTPVILTTGYGGDLVQEGELGNQGVSTVLHKPYGASELSAAIRGALAFKSTSLDS